MKTFSRKRRLNVFGLAAVLVLGLAAVAWACTAQARIIGLSTPAASPGSEVLVQGEGAQGGVPVAIYWNEVGGVKLADTMADPAGNFVASVRIPEAAADVHFLLAVPNGAETARAPFEVIRGSAAGSDSTARSERSTDLWNGFASSESASGIGQTSAPADSGSNSGGGALGIGLLAVGAVGLVSGMAVAGMRRRSSARI